MKLLVLDNPFAPPSLPNRMQWTSSSIKLFRKCKRKFFWKYIFKLHPRYKDKHLMIGSAFHNLLGEWYKQPRSSMSKLVGAYTTQLNADYKTNAGYYDQEDLDKLRMMIDCFTGMMLAYEEHYKGDRKSWKIQRTSIEKQFTLNFGDFDYCGKIDLIANNYQVEHKTASKISESYIDRLPLDTQIRGYIVGGQSLGFKFNSVMYDVVAKCKLRRKSNETIKDFSDRVAHAYLTEVDKYFYREELRFDREDLSAWQHEVLLTHREYCDIVGNGSRKDVLDPRTWNITDTACNDFFRTCEYHKLCTIGLDRGTALGYEQGKELNEELAED